MTLTLSDVVYKCDVDTNIVTKYLTKSLLSIITLFFLVCVCFFCFFSVEKLNTKYEWFLISTHLKVLLRMPIFWLRHLLIDYNLITTWHKMNFEIIWLLMFSFINAISIPKHFLITFFFEKRFIVNNYFDWYFRVTGKHNFGK